MKILFVSQYFPPEPGAPAARVSELTRAWVRAGHDVTVLTGFPCHPTGVIPLEYRGLTSLREDFHGVNVFRTWIYSAANRGRLKRMVAFGSFAVSASISGLLAEERPDVVVATSPQLLCGMAGRVIAAGRRVPFVFEVRDLWPESIVSLGVLPERHPVIRGLTALEEDMYRAAAKIVVVTHSFRDRLEERGISLAKMAVVENGADLNRFVPASRDTALRRELGYGDRFVALYGGTHGMSQGLDTVLDVARSLRNRDDIRFLFVGDGAEREQLEARARREDLTNVTFLGIVPRDRMSEVYATSDLCLVPLKKTDLFTTVIPSKIFEIMAMERPILLSVDGEARRVVESCGGGVFCPPEDADAMRTALLELVDNSELRTSMARTGRANVLKHYDRERLAQRYLGLLHEVTGIAAPRESRPSIELDP